MEPPNLETVYQAINALYENGSNKTEKEKASIWLAEVQKSIYAWKICDLVLIDKRDVQSSYFAAQTMRSKIQHSFNELPQDSYESLTNSLISHLKQVTPEGGTVVITQLCVALADLILQITTWKNCILDVVNQFSNDQAWALLEFLTVLPQEIDSNHLRIGENRREEIRQELKKTSSTVDEYLKQYLISSINNPHVTMKIFKCLSSWIYIKAVNLNTIQENAIICHTFNVLKDYNSNSMVHEAATDCLCTLLQCISEYEKEDINDIEVMIYNSIIGLEETYHLSVAHEEDEKAMNYCRLFTDLTETFLNKIISSFENNEKHFSTNSLDLVLLCVGHHDYDVAELTFNFWHRLSEELYQKNSDNLLNHFKPYIGRLFVAFYRHCQMESDCHRILEEGDDFYDFRFKVVDLIKDVVFIIGSSNCFQQMFLTLQQPNLSWEQSESALYIMQAVAKNIVPEEFEVVPKVVDAILSMPENAHIAVCKTCIQLIGELCDWIEQHQDYLERVLQYLLRSLHNKQLASSAAISLHSICKSCRNKMIPHVDCLLEIISNLDKFNLSTEASIGLIRGTALVISRLPYEQISIDMRKACAAQCNGLQNSNDPALWLDRLAALFKDIEFKFPNGVAHPCLQSLMDMWPLLSAAFDKYQQDGRIVERLCRTLRFCLRCLSKHARVLFEPIVMRVIQLYTTQGHSCCLYLSSILTDEFSSVEECIPGLVNLLQALIPKAFDILKKENGLKNNPDTVDDLFRFCTRFLQKIPRNLLENNVSCEIVQCAILSCQLDHRDANLSVMKFFCDLIHITNSRRTEERVKQLVNNLLVKYGQNIVSSLIQSSVFYLHPYMLGDVAVVIFEMMLWNKTLLAQWLGEILEEMQRCSTPPCATPSQIVEFHGFIIQCTSSKDITYTLQGFARLFR